MAEISVTGGVFATLTTNFTLWYGHRGIPEGCTRWV
ncbi:phage protein D, partial [Escherichia coli]|nr:phage protein D [Escherichia coli]